jgi:hypothetical protein
MMDALKEDRRSGTEWGSRNPRQECGGGHPEDITQLKKFLTEHVQNCSEAQCMAVFLPSGNEAFLRMLLVAIQLRHVHRSVR